MKQANLEKLTVRSASQEIPLLLQKITKATDSVIVCWFYVEKGIRMKI
jgi:hypothetical protein